MQRTLPACFHPECNRHLVLRCAGGGQTEMRSLLSKPSASWCDRKIIRANICVKAEPLYCKV